MSCYMPTYKKIQECIKDAYRFTCKMYWIAHMKEICILDRNMLVIE